MADKKTVMIIDDDEGILVMLNNVLEDEYKVAPFISAEKALNSMTLRESHQLPAVIITDVMMPNMDGYTFVNKLMEDDDMRAVPVIVVTAKGALVDNFRDLSNVFSFLEKPFDYKVLLQMVGKAAAKNS